MKEKKYKKPKLTIDELSAALYRANQELHCKNQELLELQELQKEMFANISHDLRSPITAIRSAIEYLSSLDHIEEEELKSTFLLLTTRIMSLEGLIDDIFLMTRLDNNTLGMEMENVNIGALLEEYFFSCQADSKYHNRELVLEVPAQFDYFAQVDIKKLIRVLDNLFTNAYKYSREEDTIALGARIEEQEVVVWVRDTGIGIESTLQNKVFERTYTVSTARTPNCMSGAGLGLSIAKSIVEKHGGHIWCESSLGDGSCFFFSIPITEPTP